MTKFRHSMRGVTLLEVMLVLAVAAMIIVMSIRYYQSATNSQNANVVMEQIQSITAAADNLAVGSGSYSSAGLSANVTSVVGVRNMVTPLNTTISVTGISATQYTVSAALDDGLCASVKAKLAATSHIQSANCASGLLTYTYDNTK